MTMKLAVDPEVPPLNDRCTGLLSNHMQCIRKANWRKFDDTSGREALCNICLAFAPSDIKEGYTVAYNEV